VIRILFACVGNSARSQMAEALCRDMSQDIECASAGSDPAAVVAPHAVEVMKEVGIDTGRAVPKGFKDLPDRRFDYLVTMGCEVGCPFMPGAKVVGWQIPDPHGKDIAEFRRVRDIIKAEVQKLLTDLNHLVAKE